MHARNKSLPLVMPPPTSRQQSAERGQNPGMTSRWQTDLTLLRCKSKAVMIEVKPKPASRCRLGGFSYLDKLIKDEEGVTHQKLEYRVKRRSNQSGHLFQLKPKIDIKKQVVIARNSMHIDRAQQYYDKLTHKLVPLLTSFAEGKRKIRFTERGYKEDSASKWDLKKNDHLRKAVSDEKNKISQFRSHLEVNKNLNTFSDFKDSGLEKANKKLLTPRYLIEMTKIDEEGTNIYEPKPFRTQIIVKAAFDKYKDLVNSGIDPQEVNYISCSL